MPQYPNSFEGFGVWTLEKQRAFQMGGNFPSLYAFESIGVVSVASAGGFLSAGFNGIPNIYKHLQLRIFHGSNTSSADSVDIRYNGDSGSNYTYHGLFGTGVSAGSEASSPRTAAVVPVTAIANTNTNMYATGLVDIFDYADTTKFKTQRVMGGWDVNGNGQAFIGSACWMSAAPITSLEIYTRTGVGFKQHSRFALFGIRG
jgi:hypothetical protein